MKNVFVLDIFGHERRERHAAALDFLFGKADSAALIMGDVIMKTIDPGVLQTPGLAPLPGDLRGSLQGHVELHSEVETRAKAAMADMVGTPANAAAIGKTIMSPEDTQELEHGDFFRYLRDAPDDLDLAREMGVEVNPHDGGRVAVSAAVDHAIPQQTVPLEASYPPVGPAQSDYELIG